MESNITNQTDEARKLSRIQLDKRIFSFQYFENNRDTTRTVPILLSIVDISYSGLGLSCNQRLSASSLLVFNLENKGAIRTLKVEVKWCRYSINESFDQKYRCGVQFIDLTYDDIIFINKIIKDLESRSISDVYEKTAEQQL